MISCHIRYVFSVRYILFISTCYSGILPKILEISLLRLISLALKRATSLLLSSLTTASSTHMTTPSQGMSSYYHIILSRHISFSWYLVISQNTFTKSHFYQSNHFHQIIFTFIIPHSHLHYVFLSLIFCGGHNCC